MARFSTSGRTWALLRVGMLEAFAYRGEMLVWVLATTMPLIMLALFDAVARGGPLGRYGAPQLTAYFLATFVVRQLTSSWSSWQINAEIRDGTMATRLLRPVHPLAPYAAQSLANIPLRAVVAVPVAVVMLVVSGAHELSRDPVVWGLWCVSMLGAAVLSMLVSFAVGGVAFFVESAQKLMDLWLALYFVLSGYLIPVELFPPHLRSIVGFLPFRYQIGLPVELMTGAHGRGEALGLVVWQWAWVVAMGLVVRWIWQKGIGRYSAFGG